jgi:glycosyltransferase involved in cell wall biosynthesis
MTSQFDRTKDRDESENSGAIAGHGLGKSISVLVVNDRRDDIRDSRLLEVSVVIPAKNEGRRIGRCLALVSEALKGQVNFELIVVDNESTDDTVDLAKSFPVDVIVTHAGGIGFARNSGASVAKGEVLIFLDADVMVTERWKTYIGRAVSEVYTGRPCVVTGSTYGIPERPNWIEDAWFRPEASRYPRAYLNSGHLILARRCFEEIGGFDEFLETGEDVEFSERARGLGARVIDNDELSVVHEGFPSTLGQFFRREAWHGRGDVQSLAMFFRSKVALISFGSLGACAILVMAGLFLRRDILLICWAPLSVASAAFVKRKFRAERWLPFLPKRLILAHAYLLARALAILNAGKRRAA